MLLTNSTLGLRHWGPPKVNELPSTDHARAISDPWWKNIETQSSKVPCRHPMPSTLNVCWDEEGVLLSTSGCVSHHSHPGEMVISPQGSGEGR